MARKEKDGRSLFQRVKDATEQAYSMRSVIMALPVIVAAIVLAIINIARLPSKVGLDMLASGEF